MIHSRWLVGSYAHGYGFEQPHAYGGQTNKKFTENYQPKPAKYTRYAHVVAPSTYSYVLSTTTHPAEICTTNTVTVEIKGSISSISLRKFLASIFDALRSFFGSAQY